MTRLVQDEVFRRLCRTRDYIAANHAESLSIPEMAKQAAMSPYPLPADLSAGIPGDPARLLD